MDIEEEGYTFLEAGTKVKVRARRNCGCRNPGLSYPSFSGILLEGTAIGGWDVSDVRRTDGEVISVYAFSISKDD